MKVVVNKCYGGFSLSRAAVEFMRGLGNIEASKERVFGEDGCPSTREWNSYLYDISRTDKDLVAAVEAMGKHASGINASLEIVEIPDGAEYEISEYDGMERLCAPIVWYED